VTNLSLDESDLRRIKERLTETGLGGYQAAILAHAMIFGESKVTALARAARVPTARVYEIVSELGVKGLVKMRPSRPMVCTAFSPKETVRRLLQLKLTSLRAEMEKTENVAASLIHDLDLLKEEVHASSRHSQLVRLVDVGAPSEEETRRLYRRAKNEILVFSRALEYLPRVIQDIAGALDRGVILRLILLDRSKLSPDSIKVQTSMLALLQSKARKAEVRFSRDVPLRGCIIDPQDRGAAVFLAEEAGVPLHLREAAFTENSGIVRAFAKLFELTWESIRVRKKITRTKPSQF